MTRMAITSRSPRPCTEDLKAWAVPWKLVVMVAGRRPLAAASTAFTASPSDTPGFRLNDSVTAGSCPMWLTDSGPTVCVRLATALSGTRAPDVARTYSIDSAAGSAWYAGSSCMMTLYSLFGA